MKVFKLGLETKALYDLYNINMWYSEHFVRTSLGAYFSVHTMVMIPCRWMIVHNSE